MRIDLGLLAAALVALSLAACDDKKPDTKPAPTATAAAAAKGSAAPAKAPAPGGGW